MKDIIIPFIFALLTKTGRSAMFCSSPVVESACAGLWFLEIGFGSDLGCCYDECEDVNYNHQCIGLDECDWDVTMGGSCFTKTNSPTLSPSKRPTISLTSSDDDDTDMDTLLWCLAGTGFFMALLIVLNIIFKPDDGEIANQLILV